MYIHYVLLRFPRPLSVAHLRRIARVVARVRKIRGVHEYVLAENLLSRGTRYSHVVHSSFDSAAAFLRYLDAPPLKELQALLGDADASYEFFDFDTSAVSGMTSAAASRLKKIRRTIAAAPIPIYQRLRRT